MVDPLMQDQEDYDALDDAEQLDRKYGRSGGGRVLLLDLLCTHRSGNLNDNRQYFGRMLKKQNERVYYNLHRTAY